MWHLIWVCTVCTLPFYRFSGKNGLMHMRTAKAQTSLSICAITVAMTVCKASYKPVKDGPYYLMPFVRPSVNFPCPLHNSDSVQDIFMKLGTNINHHQTMCREQEPTLHLHFLRNYAPLKFFLWKLCPLYIFDTIQNIFMKLCRNVNHHQMMCKEQEP